MDGHSNWSTWSVKILPFIGWKLAYTWCVVVLLGIWSVTSCILVCCTLWGTCYVVNGGSTGAAGVVVGSDCIILACVRCSMGICVICSSLSYMRCGGFFWVDVGSLMFNSRRIFPSTFVCCLRLRAYIPWQLLWIWVDTSVVVLLWILRRWSSILLWLLFLVLSLLMRRGIHGKS